MPGSLGLFNFWLAGKSVYGTVIERTTAHNMQNRL